VVAEDCYVVIEESLYRPKLEKIFRTHVPTEEFPSSFFDKFKKQVSVMRRDYQNAVQSKFIQPCQYLDKNVADEQVRQDKKRKLIESLSELLRRQRVIRDAMKELELEKVAEYSDDE